ncbi:Leucine-rich repeat receptor protein kinase ems1 [Thalictrum thalictroides]|uniref:Leucine-rich repeat receptor protein kinase ems1 n=1 Tax=Thalictrum thalictroides TaxID=46969 RepID=A0A7J6VBR5_THATH|nr:Leucine-rich repeat receptor protein kinase ems1 [Thalictrum thalictroides]
MSILLVLVLFSFNLLVNAAAANTLTEIIPAEHEALERWKHSLYYYEVAIVPDWNTTTSCNTSDGRITCSEEGSVIGIDLSYHHLEGNLNHLNFSSLPHLSVLILQGNNLNGTIPQEIGTLTNLIHLNLNSNLFGGDLPISLGNLTSLVHLDLSNNNLNGPIPPKIGNLNHLLELRLSHNNLSGHLPPEIGTCYISTRQANEHDIDDDDAISSLPVDDMGHSVLWSVDDMDLA